MWIGRVVLGLIFIYAGYSKLFYPNHQLRVWAAVVTLIMLVFLTVVTRAYLLHMDINCGCFATPEPVSLKKIFEDSALALLAVLMTVFAFIEARKPHPWVAPEPVEAGARSK